MFDIFGSKEKEDQAHTKKKIAAKSQIAQDKAKIDAIKEAIKKAGIGLQKASPSPKMQEKLHQLESRVNATLAMLRRTDAEYLQRKKLVKLGGKLMPFAFVGMVALLLGSTVLLTRWKDKQLAEAK